MSKGNKMCSAISRSFGISRKCVSTRQTLVSSLYQTNIQYTNMDLSLDKLSLGPKKKLLVLCLGGLLVHRVHDRDPDLVYDKFFVFKSPFCTDFLKFCFERFEVGLWSSARDHNINPVLDDIENEGRTN